MTATEIGHVENDFSEASPPDAIAAAESRVVLEPKFSTGLRGLVTGQKLLVVFHFHLSTGYELLQHPRGDSSRPRRGVFALRSPRRPNPIGVTEVELVEMEGNVLTVRGLDALDGTPILDIKPA